MGRINRHLIGPLIVIIIIAGEIIGSSLDSSQFKLAPFISLIFALISSFIITLLYNPPKKAFILFVIVLFIYGAISYAANLEFYYHDMPNSFMEFLDQILIKTAIYSLLVIIGYGLATIFIKRQKI